LPAASQGWNERVDIEPLPTHERSCFVSGHDFSRAAHQPSTMGFSPCSYLEHILFIPSEAEGSAVPRTSPGNAESSAAADLSSRPERTRISCHAAPDGTTCAAFIKESRMKFASATNFYRKSGVA
jgi:hypothetical protein